MITQIEGIYEENRKGDINISILKVNSQTEEKIYFQPPTVAAAVAASSKEEIRYIQSDLGNQFCIEVRCTFPVKGRLYDQLMVDFQVDGALVASTIMQSRVDRKMSREHKYHWGQRQVDFSDRRVSKTLTFDSVRCVRKGPPSASSINDLPVPTINSFRLHFWIVQSYTAQNDSDNLEVQLTNHDHPAATVIFQHKPKEELQALGWMPLSLPSNAVAEPNFELESMPNTKGNAEEFNEEDSSMLDVCSFQDTTETDPDAPQRGIDRKSYMPYTNPILDLRSRTPSSSLVANMEAKAMASRGRSYSDSLTISAEGLSNIYCSQLVRFLKRSPSPPAAPGRDSASPSQLQEKSYFEGASAPFPSSYPFDPSDPLFGNYPWW